MLEIGTEITLQDKTGKLHKSRICLFVYSVENRSVYAVTSAAFTNLAENNTAVSANDLPNFGTISDKPCRKHDNNNKRLSADLFGYIEIKEDFLSHVDNTCIDRTPLDKLETAQRLYTDLDTEEPALYVSVGDTEVSLPCEAFSGGGSDRTKQCIVQGLGIALTLGETTDGFLSGTPLFARGKLIAGMLIAGSPEKGFVVVPASMALHNGIAPLTANVLPPPDQEDGDTLETMFLRAIYTAQAA